MVSQRLTRTQRVLRILESVAIRDTPPTHADLVRELGVHRSTLSDILVDLREAGYIDTVDRRFVPGVRMLSFAYQASRRPHFYASIRPTLEALAESTRETAVYTIEVAPTSTAPGYIMAIDQVESPNSIRYAAPIGQPRPLHLAAAGHVFLAFGDRPLASIAARCAEDGIDLGWLEEELARVRARGYALNRPGSPTRSIAAPLRDADGSVVAAIALLGPPDRFAEPDRAWPVLRDALTGLHAGPADR